MPLDVADSFETIDKRISREYFADLVKRTVSHDFEPASEYALTLHGFPMYGYPLPSDIEHKAKILISDMDLTWTRTQIFYVVVKLLSRINEGIKNREGKIFKSANELRRGNVDGPVEDIQEQFVESRVAYWQYEWACAQTPRYVGLKKNSIPALSKLKKMYYDIYFFSGSPQLAVEYVVGMNMHLAGFGLNTADLIDGFDLAQECVIATEYKPDEDGYISEIIPVIYEYKDSRVEKKLKETVGTTKGFNIGLSDELGDKDMVRTFINPLILLSEMRELLDVSEGILIPLPEANNDMMLIPPAVSRIENALCVGLGHRLETQKKIFYSASRLKKTYEQMEKEKEEKDLTRLRNEALDAFKEYKSLTWKLFSTKKEFTGLGSIVRKLETAKDGEEIKSVASTLTKEFRKYSPHYDIAEHMLKYF